MKEQINPFPTVPPLTGLFVIFLLCLTPDDFTPVEKRLKAFLNRLSCEEWMEHCKHIRCKYIAQNVFMYNINK